MIQAFLDESGTHRGANVCAIAGYFGAPNPMRKFERAWKHKLAEFKFPIADFHATDLITSTQHHPMLIELARIAGEQRKVYPVTWAIFVDDFNSFSLEQRRFMTGAILDPFAGKLRSSGCASKPYFVPFQNVVKLITDATPVGSKAHFAFGLNTEFASYALALYRQIVDNPPPKDSAISTWKTRRRLGSMAFPAAASTAQLQAADLLVHTSYRLLKDWRVTGRKDGSLPIVYELLNLATANMRRKGDHVYQGKAQFEQTLSQAKTFATTWKDS
jgi:hypothetical protein